MDIEAGLILYLKKVSQCIKNTTGIYSVGTKIMYYMYWVLKGSIDFYFPAVRLFLPTATPTPHHRRFRMDITPCFWGVLDSIHWWWR